MEGSREFSCYQNTTLFGRRNKNEEVLYLKVANGTLSGKGYVCNEEGKNGYVDEFSFKISEVSSALIGKYNGAPAFIFNARISNLYGAKKAQIALPQMKDAESALDLINNLRRTGESQPAEKTSVSSMAQVPPTLKEKIVDDEPEMVKHSSSVAEIRANQASAAPAPTPARPERRVIDEPFQPQPYVDPKANKESTSAAPAQPTMSGSTSSSSSRVADNKLSSDEFQKRMEKLTVLKDCGLLGEKEFKSKKIELVSEFCDLSEFNEKIQKMIILKDCGVLSEKEFEANRNDIIKECCNLETRDLEEYKQNIQKLSFLEMGDVITAEEFAAHTQSLIDDVEFSLDDDKETFQVKLRKLPILRDNQVISDSEHKKRVSKLFKMIELLPDEPLENWSAKLNKWPILADEQYISVSDLKTKQKELIENCLDVEWKNLDELQAYINKMVALRDGDWLSKNEFLSRKTDLLKQIDSMPDYPSMLQARILLPKVGLITEADYDSWKQRCISDIFAPSSDMSAFKGKANNLMELQQAGVITEKEFTDYKIKLMSEL